MKRVIPDGEKIAALRDKRGQKQVTLATVASISDRQMRKIEKQNAKISEDQLVSIAKFLEVSPEEIKFKPKLVASPFNSEKIIKSDFGISMKLVPVTGGDLFRMAKNARKFHYKLNTDPNKTTAQLFEDALSIIHCQVSGSEDVQDGFEDRKFPDIHRIARINEVVDLLMQNGVSILANYYYRTTYIKDRYGNYTKESINTLHMAFVEHNTQETRVYVWDDDPVPEGYQPPDIDDDIPF